MTNPRTVTLAVVALLSVSFLASRAVASEMSGVMMKGGKMMMMKTGPMKHAVTMTNGCKVMPDGTMKMKDGKEMHMAEGQMMMMDGTMMEGGKAMDDANGMKMDGMKMDGMKKDGMKMDGMGK